MAKNFKWNVGNLSWIIAAFLTPQYCWSTNHILKKYFKLLIYLNIHKNKVNLFPRSSTQCALTWLQHRWHTNKQMLAIPPFTWVMDSLTKKTDKRGYSKFSIPVLNLKKLTNIKFKFTKSIFSKNQVQKAFWFANRKNPKFLDFTWFIVLKMCLYCHT